MKNDPYAWLEQSLKSIERAGWQRSTQTIDRPGAVIQIDNRQFLNFASNDYLGLATDDRLINAAIQAIQNYGTGSTGSRLLTGHRALHRELETAIAQLKQAEDAIVFSSGYLANLGAIAALVGKRDLILSDQYNHSSLRNGAIVSGATTLDYAHCDIQDLRTKLEQQRQHFQHCLIITDTVFSMDGDLCPLPEILDLADEFECMVLVDEAHATGVMGATGAGCVEHLGCTGRAIVQMGTLSKALGSLGGYIAGSAQLIDFLRNRAPSWIYTTGLSPADTAAALAAIQIVQQERDRRNILWQNVAYLKSQLPNFALLPSESPILCWQLPNVQTALEAAKSLQAEGIFAPAIRPPTVPTSRIRMTIMATHEKAHLDRLVAALNRVQKDVE
ncbi:8-amino-7-oxononanoate synthase [Leptolyngbya boryana NIES-2135]|jgi:8-amino-7-oxononanoate synthase|uniref:8-amino-7-ketopelargonate synthase n=1 Tax=Leptolyngbya boryana NIES-2135 TaxID=1973484 RepID=A0A1Z4JMS1_LEPBY|nr:MULTISPECIES: 8-amino-7-oxononanoate synthase [Leptolyngbya]BAY58042.1 8-amino-7-oxononanoate synthase [Leptolyngbya boryana NIES-2135]MBD2367485.1 8-amino-7-oxononanoate synthase [Leptolyngbya sp. FACHB-161]MBD2374009.1 8-amino-7-oxononanoate synthase [Leptolyngbya sp. FACHB-238]MBD2398191.1 8-amino-7-oxononanoate synthase [Leptolyngbya sp. FACHB-239]MBD2404312.1 8-amino-7-oxononanoate synthase [Leptolyngbya sp. FACHB-402]